MMAQELGPAPLLSGTMLHQPFRLTLTGDPQTATPLVTEQLGVIPFGRWLNAVPLKKVQHGFQVSLQLEHCSGAGCTVSLEAMRRVLVAKRDIASGIRLDIYDEGWKRSGMSAITARQSPVTTHPSDFPSSTA